MRIPDKLLELANEQSHGRQKDREKLQLRCLNSTTPPLTWPHWRYQPLRQNQLKFIF